MQIKKLLAHEKYRIELHDLIQKTAYNTINQIEIHVSNDAEVYKKAKDYIDAVDEASKNLRDIFIYGCYFGTVAQNQLWQETLNLLSRQVVLSENNHYHIKKLSKYTPMLLQYTGGISAVAKRNAKNVKAILQADYIEGNVHASYLEPKPLSELSNIYLLGNVKTERLIFGDELQKTPFSIHLNGLLKSDFQQTVLFNEDNFDQFFDEWEIILAVQTNLRKGSVFGSNSFCWRNVYANKLSKKHVFYTIKTALETDRDDNFWTQIFDYPNQQVLASIQKLEEDIERNSLTWY